MKWIINHQLTTVLIILVLIFAVAVLRDGGYILTGSSEPSEQQKLDSQEQK